MRPPVILQRAGVRTVAVLLMGLVAGGGVWAVDGADPRAPGLTGEERFERLLARVRHEQARVERLSARFVQHKESALLIEPDESTGEFFYEAPDRVRWVYLEPAPMQIVIRDEEMLTWFEDLGSAERMRIGKVSDQVLKYLGASNSLELLERYFDVRAAFPADPTVPYRLELEPRFERVARRLAGMTIWVHPELYLPSALRYEEADGDVTEYRFEGLEVNGTLPEHCFDLVLPGAVEVRTVDLGRGG